LEKVRLIIEVLKVLIRTNASISTRELHKILHSKGILGRPEDKVERRRLLRALSTLAELDYIEEAEEGKRKRWSGV